MPYQTFFNLPEEKRKRILDAAWDEFTTVSFSEASINRIIHAAEISRGSYYQYFSGKQDLFAYLMGTVLTTAKEMFAAELTAHNNDLFSAILGMYDMILWLQNRGRFRPEQQRIYQLLKLNRDMDPSTFTDYLDHEAMSQNLQELLLRSGYNMESSEACHALFTMLASVGLSNVAQTMRHPQHEAQNRSLLEHQLLIIRRGLMPYKQI